MSLEQDLLLAGLALYAAASVAAVVAATLRRAGRVPLAVLALALAVHGGAILLRWHRLGHGPYVDLYEVLSSNVWSLHLALLTACLVLPPIRATLALALPLLQIGVAWLLSLTPVDNPLPVTYDTVWLPVHVWLGKVFLGCVLAAVAVSLVILARRIPRGPRFSLMPASIALDELAYRLVLIAFVFESLMLVVGAVWAQDAWGRYWAWDPLETWAFTTWIMVIAFLHLRATRRPSATLSAMLVVGLFLLAFSTLFGMPFVSTAPHKGAV
jgi:ABC-type transport system involved in cytochrome c biogenesis permease subunit